MASDLAYGLLPDHLLLALVLVLMLLETVGAHERLASLLLRLALLGGLRRAMAATRHRLCRRAVAGRDPHRSLRVAREARHPCVRPAVVARVPERHVQVGLPGRLVLAGRARHHGQCRLHPAFHGHRDALAPRVRADRARRRSRDGSGRSIQVPAAFGGRERLDAVRHRARVRRDGIPGHRSFRGRGSRRRTAGRGRGAAGGERALPQGGGVSVPWLGPRRVLGCAIARDGPPRVDRERHGDPRAGPHLRHGRL